jgi:hypothetical protein
MSGPDVSALAGVALVDDRGAPARLGDAWKDRPAAVFFLRHWG